MALPKYNTREYITFLQDMRRTGRRVFHFQGNCFWSGPAVKITNITELYDIQSDTKVPTFYEQDSNGFIVHPYIRGE